MNKDNDRQQIEKLRLIVQEAENTGNLEMMTAILADDITVIAPGSPVINTKAGGVDFLPALAGALLFLTAGFGTLLLRRRHT